MAPGIDSIVANFSKSDALDYLTDLDFALSGYVEDNELDYNLVYANLIRLIGVFCDAKLVGADGKIDAKAQKNNSVDVSSEKSHAVFALLSRNIVSVLAKLPNKIYDTANNLLPFLAVDENGDLHPSGQLASVVLIDILGHYPSHLPALINFAANLLYKIVKKTPIVDSNIAFLLSSVLLIALKTDVDEKFQAKWVKLLLRTITQYSVVNSTSDHADDASDKLTVPLTKSYLQALKSVLMLQVSSHYEQLLEISASSTSGLKLKPEQLMAQQNLFQTIILANHEKLFQFGLLSHFSEVRAATVNFISTLLLNFVDTGKFNGFEYLLDLYPLPPLNAWDETLLYNLADAESGASSRKESNSLAGHDSELAISANANLLSLQIGTVETFIMYSQLQLFGNWDYYPSQLCGILDLILLKFGPLQLPNHIQNQQWARTLSHWRTVVEFLVKESGSSTHEILTAYVAQKFSTSSEKLESESRSGSPAPGQFVSKEKRRELGLFGFKPTKKSKTKGPSKEINPYINGYQFSLLACVIEILLPYGLDFAITSENDDETLDNVNEITYQSLAEEEDRHTTKRSSYISALLVLLLVNDSSYIRSYALTTLIKYVQINRAESNQLILEVFMLVTGEYETLNSGLTETVVSSSEKNVSVSITVRLFSYALALLSLIKQSDATLLQNSTIAKILSFCTQNLKQSSNASRKYLKNAACWIILSALVNFHSESEFVKLNSSQFLVFWKNLLTSQFISSDLNAGSEQGQLNEIVNNLKLRSLSLICLLNYISSVQLTSDLSKQLQFLLIKSHKYLLYLESNLEAIGQVTSFHPQAFNELNYNANLVGNLLFSNFNDSNLLSMDKQLISLILYNKKIILQGFIKLAGTLKSDVNSSLVVFLMKVFADPKTFSRTNTEHVKDKSKGSKTKLLTSKSFHENSNAIFIDEEYNYNFGVTSKFNPLSSNIDELTKTDSLKILADAFLQYSDPFSGKMANYSKSSIESSLEISSRTWIDHFELRAALTAEHSVIFDPAVLLLQDYSLQHQHSTNSITSLVDLSIELFQLVFPSLSFKIQFSLLEQLRASLSTKNLDPLRKRVLNINLTVAIHGLLNNLVKSGGHLDEQLVTLALEIINHIEVQNIALVTICADSTGLATSLLPKSKADEAVSSSINGIVNSTDPHVRVKLLLSLSKISQYSHVGFSDIFSVVSQLLADPHPVVAYYALLAAGNIAETALGNQVLVSSIVGKIYDQFVSDSYTYTSGITSLINLRSTYNSLSALSRLLKIMVTSLGPSLRDSEDSLKRKIVQLLLLLSYGIGSTNLTEYNSVLTNLMSTFQELLIFDVNFVDGLYEWFKKSTTYLVTTNMKTGLAIVSPTSVNSEAIFPLTTSYELYELAFSGLVEMTKIGLPTLDKDTLGLAWVSMEMRPCASLRELITFWVEAKIEILWFTQLTALFKLSVRRLIGPFVEMHYQQKLLPLSQRQKKKATNTIDFQDEEVQNIVRDDESGQDKSEPISWEFKLFVYDLIIKFLEIAQRKPLIVESLTPKIQEIVRISFLGTTAPISSMKLRGVVLLDQALSIFGQLEDPLYPSVSILEQQQAQIISALIPCFSSDTDPEVIVKAINVSTKFINLPRIKFYSKQRILKTLIYLLEEISSGKFLKFVFLESMAEYGKKAIQLSILNCWANLRITLEELTETEPEFEGILNKYSDLLTSLWILLLKDFSTTKYNLPHSRELQLYSTYWLNFVGVLSLELEKDDLQIKKFLEDEELNFFFVMFCQCAESLIKNQNVSLVLHSVNRLVQIPELVQTLFSDELFGEVIDLVDRLVLMEEDPEIKCEVIETVSTMFHTYIALKSGSDLKDEKVMELLRVTLLPLFDIFPFLRLDFSPENAGHTLLLKHCNSATNLLVLKKSLSVGVLMIHQFEGEVQYDLSSCIMYILAKIFEHGDDTLTSLVLPTLKSLVSENPTLATPFLAILRQTNTFASQNKATYILTMMVLVTSGGVQLAKDEDENLANALVSGLSDSEYASTSVQAIKSLIKNFSMESSSGAIVKAVLKLILRSIAEVQSGIDKKIALEIVLLFSQLPILSADSSLAMYAICVPVLVEMEKQKSMLAEYLNLKILALVKNNPQSFKKVVNDYLDNEQKVAAERLVKLNQATTQATENGSEIELKTFT